MARTPRVHSRGFFKTGPTANSNALEIRDKVHGIGLHRETDSGEPIVLVGELLLIVERERRATGQIENQAADEHVVRRVSGGVGRHLVVAGDESETTVSRGEERERVENGESGCDVARGVDDDAWRHLRICANLALALELGVLRA